MKKLTTKSEIMLSSKSPTTDNSPEPKLFAVPGVYSGINRTTNSTCFQTTLYRGEVLLLVMTISFLLILK